MKWTKCAVLFSILFSSVCYPQLHAKIGKKDRLQADYVVVGVGTAGAVFCKMLTDDKKTSVIALQNGPNLSEDPFIKYSQFSLVTVVTALFGPPLYITGETIPQVNADNRSLEWAMAIPLGGASSINAGAWCRGTNAVYSQWEELNGPLWSTDRITEDYIHLENYNGETTDPALRGYCGPIGVRQNPTPSQVSQKFNQATIDATGVPFALDYNVVNVGCSTQMQYTESGPNGIFRVSSNTAFLDSSVMTSAGRGVNGRKLNVQFESTGLRTLWKGNKAIGVEYLQNGKRKKVYAKKGVIICAGFYSSKFLMNSGVGPSDVLEDNGINVVVDNENVGQGLADQPSVRILWTSNPDDTPENNNNSIFANITWLPSPPGPGVNPDIRTVRTSTVSPIPGITLMIVDLLQPFSRGSITINSCNPEDPPVVDLGVLNDPADLDLFVQTFQVYIKGISDAIQEIDPDYQLLFPPADILDDTELVTAFIKDQVASNEHFQCHCKMAPRDQGGVVDNRGLVYGTQNLWVADDSTVPVAMDGSPMATAYLMAYNTARIMLRK